MKNTSKILAVLAVSLTACTVFAGPPPPHHHDHGDHDGTNGVRLATDIVRLVGASLNVIAPRQQTVVVTQPAAVVQPVIIPQSVVVPPPPQRPAPPPPPSHGCGRR